MDKISRIISPASIALIGVSSNLQKGSGRLLANLVNTKFKGEIYLVNPYYRKVLHMDCHPSILDVSQGVDLACIVSPPATVPGIVTECIEKGVKSIVILSDGFSEANSLTNKVRQQLEELKKRSDIVFYGPNAEGLSLFHEKWGLSTIPVFESKRFKAGSIGLISVGNIGQSIVDSNQKGIGFSYWFSPGDEIGVTVEDCLEYLVEHSGTKVILLLVQSVMDKKRFKSLLTRAYEKNKPIIYLRTGARHDLTNGSSTINGKSLSSQLKESPSLIEVKGIKEMISLAWLFDKGYHLTPVKPFVFTWSPGIASYLENVFEDYKIDLADISDELNHKLQRIGDNKKNPLNVSSVIYKDLNLAVDSLKDIVRSKEYNFLIIAFPFQMNYHNEVIARVIVELNVSEEVLFMPIFLSQGSHQELALEIIKESSVPYLFDEHIAIKSLAYLYQYNESMPANTIV